MLLRTAAFLVSTCTVLAAPPQVIPVWPGKPPGETAPLPPEANVTTPQDRTCAGRPIIRIGNVSQPTLTVYKPDPAKDTGAAVLVCPGGGYVRLAVDIEGTEICDWLNSLGVTGIILKYRVPPRAGLPRWAPPLQDAQRALGLVRHRAAELGLDPHRLGIIGFSAGANLSAVLSTHQDERTYPAIDAADAENCRPDFTLLIYPGGLRANDHGIVPEAAVTTGKTPPTFLVQTEDDPVHVENAVDYYLALKNANVPAEMHLYSTGGHGYGLRATGDPVSAWPERAATWLKAGGWLNRR